MRHILFDTDTASDDAVALVMSLRCADLHIEAVTCVCGNITLPKVIRNARIAVEKAATYRPPVYAGMARPLFGQPTSFGEQAHGPDGLGGMNYPEPSVPLSPGHAVDQIIRLAREVDDLEILALGPLTNIAMAILLAPEAMKRVKNITLMGGQYRMIDAFTANAEFNIAMDAEAAKIVFASGMHLTVVPIDVCYGHTEIDAADRAVLRGYHTEVGDFYIDANRTLLEMNKGAYGKDIISMPDPTAAAVVMDPGVVRGRVECFADVEVKSPFAMGELLYDFDGRSGNPQNCTLITEIDPARFKEMVFASADH
ncbi:MULTISPECIES: nucleoside hydrolase [Eubacteriales]|uniref:Nucleoside hydrolase n=1 Tax=Bittarella massiliensis (ex Durand et al. 2017) TaxID=1720313 RepID=A0AAQ1MF43_9FIRM|nr:MULTISPECIES: nucleoside hydrolase [Eubacteriales]ERI96379.1 Inosine-uridine preferring nucleoside hydrolase [Clostridium sp. ATCC 29733]MCQ4949885.1 nucleoside hydrolase [Bittarella massiliensis (ex Durand et al. 2017)]MZL69812.1 ribonucleoside hydrolase [Bittarella massiliensis (ex Durand et al. 2017)]MZL81417.1 ribonucleoside hydrolase [Bittarella massiliensis (ex Durand et al. 2017)]SHG49052.1 purine nucleosidase [Bittarella massiliensis (ex Durand et al. 2017)]